MKEEMEKNHLLKKMVVLVDAEVMMAQLKKEQILAEEKELIENLVTVQKPLLIKKQVVLVEKENNISL